MGIMPRVHENGQIIDIERSSSALPGEQALKQTRGARHKQINEAEPFALGLLQGQSVGVLHSHKNRSALVGCGQLRK